MPAAGSKATLTVTFRKQFLSPRRRARLHSEGLWRYHFHYIVFVNHCWTHNRHWAGGGSVAQPSKSPSNHSLRIPVTKKSCCCPSNDHFSFEFPEYFSMAFHMSLSTKQLTRIYDDGDGDRGTVIHLNAYFDNVIVHARKFPISF